MCSAKAVFLVNILYDALILKTITSFHHHFLFQKLELVKSKDENESLQKSLKGMLINNQGSLFW